MSIVLAIVIGIIAFLAGIGLAYSLLENRLNVQEQRHRARTRREVEDVERVSADRMQKRIDALKSQYETQIQQLTHQLELAQLESKQAPPAIVEPIVEPEPEPEPIVETPEPEASLSEAIVEPAVEPEPVLEPEPEPIVETPEPEASLSEAIVEPAVEPEPVLEPEPEPIVETPEPEASPVLATPTYEELPTTLEFSDADTSEPEQPSEPEQSSVPPVPPSPVTIAPATPQITLEDLQTLPFSADRKTHLQLATHLLTLLQTQPYIELSKRSLLKVLKGFSQDPTPELRELAVLCLSHIRSPLVVPLLRQRLRDTDVAVVKAANEALEPWRAHSKPKPSKLKSRKLKPSKVKTQS
jgi:hypothetical protein